jgi:hypothetical protein
MDSYYICPIYFFEFDGEQINLPEEIQIIKIPRGFTEYLDKNYPDSLPTILSEAKWAIAIKNERIDTTNLDRIEAFSRAFAQQDKAITQLVDLFTALRLYKEGRVVAGLLISAAFDNSEWSIGGSTIWTSISNIHFFNEELTYVLRQSELQKLITLFQQIRTWRISGILKNVDIALRRFHSSYHGNIEDRIIDQMIAFESLYIGDNKELTYKLAMRTAFLLRKRKDFRKKVFMNMKNAYNFRSEIVHGNVPPNRKKLKIIVLKTENYLRQSIIKFLVLLSQGKSLNKIRENLLDDNIFTNGRTLTDT